MVDSLREICKLAGTAILDIYNDPESAGVVDHKSDNSPLTLADRASHNVIKDQLESRFPEIPILSEEGRDIPYSERSLWKKYWLVDPLDGTKEFIKRNGEFTINIALIENGLPVAGIIYVPVVNEYYIAFEGATTKVDNVGSESLLQVNNKVSNRIAVRSRSHASEEEDAIMTRYGVVGFISVGSSLKFCMVAEGKADLYYRHGPTMEWDTAAGQAILEGAGGRVYKGSEPKKSFTYNKEDLLNGSFLCLGFDN